MEKKENINTFKLANSKLIKIYTIVLYLVSVLLYEFFCCNAEFIENFVNRLNNDTEYFFSPIRIVIYSIFLILYLIFNKKFTNTAVEAMQVRMKRILIYAYHVFMIIGISYVYVRIFNNITAEMLFSETIKVLCLLSGSIFIIYVSKNQVKNVIVASMTFGIIFCIMTEYYHALDEKKHFMTAFNMANFHFNYVEDPIQTKDLEEMQQIMPYKKFIKFYSKKYEGTELQNIDKEDVPSTPTTYLKILYVIPTIGIFVAKTIGGSVADIYIIGRLANIILYAFLVCIALKITPYKKNIFMVIAMMPMSMLLAASYSIDGACIGVVFIFVAYVFKLSTLEKIKAKQWIILALLFILMMMAKTMAYLAVGALILILPLWKIIKNKSKKVKIGLSISAIIILILAIASILYVKKTMIVSDSRGAEGIDAAGQIEYIIKNPLKIALLEFNYIANSIFNFQWLHAIHPHVFFSQNYASIEFFAIMILIIYTAIVDDEYNLKTKEKLVCIGTFFMVFFMTNIILYITFTPVGDVTIAGYQPRYLLPILPILLVSISSKNLQNKNENISLIISTISGIIVMTSLLSEVLSYKLL